MGSVVYSFTTKPGTPRLPGTDDRISRQYATQRVILDEEGHLPERRCRARRRAAPSTRPASAPSRMEGGVHMGLGYALSEHFPTTAAGRPR